MSHELRQDINGRWRWYGGRPPHIDGERRRALRWSTLAFGEARDRAVLGRDNGRLQWVAAVEGLWWALALDESYDVLLKGQVEYRAARDGDPDGVVVGAMRWLRNRHAHDLVITGRGGPKRTFLQPNGFYISPSNRWSHSRDIVVAPSNSKKAEDNREAYDEHVALHRIEDTLASASRFFDKMAQACDLDLADTPDSDQTVL